MKILINTSNEFITINGEVFGPEQWKHVPDDFGQPTVQDAEMKEAGVVDMKLDGEVFAEKTLLADYPEIKEAHVVLAERTQKVLEENGLINMARGLEEAAVMYETEIAPVAVDLLKYRVERVEPIDAMPVEAIEPVEMVKI